MPLGVSYVGLSSQTACFAFVHPSPCEERTSVCSVTGSPAISDNITPESTVLARTHQCVRRSDGPEAPCELTFEYWQDAKAEEKQAIQRLRQLIIQEVKNDCF